MRSSRSMSSSAVPASPAAARARRCAAGPRCPAALDGGGPCRAGHRGRQPHRRRRAPPPPATPTQAASAASTSVEVGRRPRPVRLVRHAEHQRAVTLADHLDGREQRPGQAAQRRQHLAPPGLGGGHRARRRRRAAAATDQQADRRRVAWRSAPPVGRRQRPGWWPGRRRRRSSVPLADGSRRLHRVLGRARHRAGGVAADPPTEAGTTRGRVDRRRLGAWPPRRRRTATACSSRSSRASSDRRIGLQRLVGELHERHLEQQPRVRRVAHLDEHLAEPLHRPHDRCRDRAGWPAR